MSSDAPTGEWLRIGRKDVRPEGDAGLDVGEHGDSIRRFLTNILQTEHLALLLGNGLTLGAAIPLGVDAPSMAASPFELELSTDVAREAERAAKTSGRGEANVEDHLNAALTLLRGLQIMEDPRAEEWNSAITDFLRSFVTSLIKVEADLANAFRDTESGRLMLGSLESLILTFANRTASRERLHVFTTNYDRLIEFVADSAALHVLDNFVGTVRPTFRAPRLSVDVHYNPPGLRGEPRYLEGVIRFTKLHGSVDWKATDGEVLRIPTMFGEMPENLGDAGALLVYPNAAKDTALSAYPYSELFRDYSAAIVRPQSAVITYGYGFGDQHINAILRAMLRIPSTHLVIISYDDPGGRVGRFAREAAQSERVSVILGAQLASLRTLATHLLPATSIRHVVQTGDRDPDESGARDQ